MTRREALKKMGMVAAGIGLGIGGVHAVDVLGLSEKEEKRGKMKILAINGQLTQGRQYGGYAESCIGGAGKGKLRDRTHTVGRTYDKSLQSLFRLYRKEKLRVRR